MAAAAWVGPPPPHVGGPRAREQMVRANRPAEKLARMETPSSVLPDRIAEEGFRPWGEPSASADGGMAASRTRNESEQEEAKKTASRDPPGPECSAAAPPQVEEDASTTTTTHRSSTLSMPTTIGDDAVMDFCFSFESISCIIEQALAPSMLEYVLETYERAWFGDSPQPQSVRARPPRPTRPPPPLPGKLQHFPTMPATGHRSRGDLRRTTSEYVPTMSLYDEPQLSPSTLSTRWSSNPPNLSTFVLETTGSGTLAVLSPQKLR